jgi:two-component system, OmpR family, sensor histidine kinase CiaH
MRRIETHRSNVAHATRVAAVATLLLAVIYGAVSVVLDTVDGHHLVGQVDEHLSERLADVRHHLDLSASHPVVDDDHDVEDAPVLLWRVLSSGRTEALSDGAPHLPAGAWNPSGQPTTARLGTVSFRLKAVAADGGYLVAAQSLADTAHVEGVLVSAELIGGPVLLLALFLGALVIGLKASRPVEAARRRQLEFAADASHELRTPLSVIEAEVGLALSHDRPAVQYRDTLVRIGSESHRLRRIVEDLLWLARFDSEPPPPGNESVDVAAVAARCADRFQGVAHAREVTIEVAFPGAPHAWISAPEEWIDRLTGVLVDNACRHGGRAGTVRILVESRGHRVTLAVEDSGTGIAVEDRDRLFDRFHRATDLGSGAGLGLAIADSVVRSTGGLWAIGSSPLGGARMAVTWHGAPPSPSETRSAVPAGEQQPEAGRRQRVGLG